MVNKIEVNPLGVRGAGNIVSPKSLTDYGSYNSKLVEASEDVNGTTMTVYTVSYVNGTYFTITSGDVVPYGASSFVVSATLKRNDNDSAIGNATVTCTVNDDTVLTNTTNSSGVVSFTVDTDDTVQSYIVKLQFGGLSGCGGCFKVTRVLVIPSSEGYSVTEIMHLLSSNLVKNPVFLNNQIRYDSYSPSEITSMDDLNGVVVGLRYSDNRIVYDTFESNNDLLYDPDLTKLENAITNLRYSNYSILYDKIGEINE